MKIYVTSTVLYLIASCIGLAQQPAQHPRLIAFSLSNARNMLSSDEALNVGHITKVWAVASDSLGDVIVVGESDPNSPCISLNLLITALKTRNKINSTVGDDPGVSIEPFDKSSDMDIQKVRYTGGIEGTDYGRIVFEADLLLKLLSEGFVSSGIEGLPSETDLSIDNEKDGRKKEIWESKWDRSWFFPFKVNYRSGYECVAATSLTVRVKNQSDELVRLPRGTTLPDEESIRKLLSEDPLRTSPLYAKLISQNFEALSKNFPVLQELKNAYALSGLFNDLLKNKPSNEMLVFWENGFELRNIETPVEIPTLRIHIPGLAYSYGLSGGVSAQFFYNTEPVASPSGVFADPWTEEVLFKNPVAIRDGAIKSRPSANAVSWVIPLGFGEPKSWTIELIEKLNLEEKARIESQYHHENKPCTCRNTQSIYSIAKSNPPLIQAFGWNPKTEGKNLFSFSGELSVNTGGREIYNPTRIYKAASSDLSAQVYSNLKYVYDNKVELNLTVPYVLALQIFEQPSTLPGIADYSIKLNSGFESPSLTNRILLYSGAGKNNKWKYPQLILNNAVVLPFSAKAFEFKFGDEDVNLPLGAEAWSSSHGMELSMPIGQKFHLQGFGVYRRTWKEFQPKQLITLFSVIYRVDVESDLSLILRNRADYIKAPKNPFGGDGAQKFEKEGSVWTLSFFYPRKFGYNSIGIGYYFPKSDAVKGGIVLDVSFGGDRLWDYRKWHGKKTGKKR